jgi:membrane-associated protein
VSGLIDRILGVNANVAYALVALFVFVEDALFVGFVLPGETAAVLGGVVASRGQAHLWVMLLIVVAAAIIGDTTGYEVGRHLGQRILATRFFDKRRARLDGAQEFLRRRGGAAVFFGRFVAFFRAVMPALAGTSRMSYPRFLAFNAAGGLVWGVGFVMLGFLAGDSYKRIETAIGQGSALLILLVVVVALAIWRIRKRRTNTDQVSSHADEK